MSAIHNTGRIEPSSDDVVCDIGGYEFVSYSQLWEFLNEVVRVVCDIGGYEFVSYSQLEIAAFLASTSCL